MDEAIDKISGIEVKAIKALQLKRRYLCPKCYADCHLCIGKKTTYFAHDSGKASADCENYHCNKNTTKKDLTSLRSSNRCQLPSLYVQSYREINFDLRAWKLLLLIPECPKESGSVEISDGYYGTVTIPVQKLKNGGQKVQVLPKTVYSIKLNGQVDPNYDSLFVKPIVGLNNDRFNIFFFSTSGGRKLQARQALFWGQAYYIVWHKDLDPHWWPQNSLATITTIIPNSDWNCAIIELPEIENTQLKKWLKKILNREIKLSPGTLSIVAPAVNKRLDDDTIQLSADAETILNYSNEYYNNKLTRMCLQLPNGSVDMLDFTCLEKNTFISIGKMLLGRTDIWFPENPNIGLSLLATNENINFSPPGVQFTFKQADQKSISFPAHCISAKTYLTELGRGRISLAAVSIPQGVPSKVCIRDKSVAIWQDKFSPFEYGDNEEKYKLKHREFEENICRIIQNNVTIPHDLLELDFGHYGKIKLTSLPILEQKVYKIDHRTRLQLQWITTMIDVGNNKNHSSSREGIKKLELWLKQIPLSQFTYEDRLIFSRLLTTRLIPSNVEAQLRNIINRFFRNSYESNQKTASNNFLK